MEIVGKIIQVLPLQEGVSKNGKEWKLKTFILETQEQYPRKACIELFGDINISKYPCEKGELVTVSFDLESREFNGRWYTSVRAWKVQKGDATNPPQQAAISFESVPSRMNAEVPVAPSAPLPTFDAVQAQAPAGESSELPF